MAKLLRKNMGLMMNPHRTSDIEEEHPPLRGD